MTAQELIKLLEHAVELLESKLGNNKDEEED